MKNTPAILLILFLGGLLSFTLLKNDNETILSIVDDYKSYSLVSNYTPLGIDKAIDFSVYDSTNLNWTIQLCTAYKCDPSIWDKNIASKKLRTNPDLHISSAAPSLSPHGDKVYKLYVKDYEQYLRSEIQPEGQVVVKETWNVQEVHKDSISNMRFNSIKSRNDGKWYTPTTVSQLFIMFKEAKSDSNDQGWVYATVDIEEPKIIRNGMLSDCISCHKSTKYDRLFQPKGTIIPLED